MIHLVKSLLDQQHRRSAVSTCGLRAVMVCLTLMLVIAGCGSETPSEAKQLSHVFSGPIMGTEFRVTVVADAKQLEDVDLLGQKIEDALHSVNRIMSHYDPESELSQLRAQPAGVPIPISSELHFVFSEANRINALSGGAFDITLSPIIDAWGFGPSGKITKQPTHDELQAMRARIGSDKFSLSDHAITKHIDTVDFNLSAIAKGYAVDYLATLLLDIGFDNFLVDVGGELIVKGLNAEQMPWRIGVEKPHVLGGIGEVIEVSDTAIATSGDYRNFIELDGQRYSHTIDYQTLQPVFHKLASVTVLHPSATTADALATAILALGHEAGLRFADDQGIKYYALIREPNDVFSVRSSDNVQGLFH